MTSEPDEQQQLRRYLLGELGEAEEAAVEVRLLDDADYSEELDIVADELIDEYANERVPDGARESVERFVFASPERVNKLKFALALKKRAAERAEPVPQPVPEPLPQPQPRRTLPRWLALAASLLLVVGLGAGVWRAFFYRSDVDKGRLALRQAYGRQRPVEPRVADFGYAPTAETRGGGPTESVRSDLAASLLTNAVLEHPGADSHHALGQFYITTREFDKAVEQLRASLSLDPQNAKAHSDLGVALLERGKSRGPGETGAMQDFGESLQHIERAIALDDSLLEALFNRALLREHMLLPEKAAEDWRAYLAKDPDSEWADEAQRHLRRLEEEQRDKGPRDVGRVLQEFRDAHARGDEERCRELLGASYTSAGNAITNALLDSYLDSEAAGRGAGELQLLTYVGQLESRRAGDSYTADLVGSYLRASPAERQALARARRQMRRGYEHYLRSELNDALGELGQARSAFAGLGNEQEALFAEYLISLCHLFQLDLARTESFFQRLAALCEERNYVWLHAHSLYRLGMLRQNHKKSSEAIEYGLRALAKLEHAGDSNGAVKVLINLADEYEGLNDPRQSLVFLQRGLAVAAGGGAQPSEVWGLYTAAGLNLNALDLPTAALAYQQEALRLALRMERPLYVSRSAAYLGATYGKLERYDEALTHISQALSAGGRLAGELSGQEMVANASLYGAEIHRRRGDHDRAIESYDRSISFYAEHGFPYFRYMAHKGKLLSLLARNNDPSVEDELRTVLGIFEQYRLDLTREGQRNTFYDVEQGVYDRVMDFAYAKKQDAGLAFDYSELSRSRSLLDALQQGVEVAAGAGGPELRLVPGAAPLPVAEIRQRMPGRAQILQYAVLEDKVLAWLVTPSGVVTEEIRIDARELEGKVRAYLKAVESGGGEAEEGARDLYDLLVRRFETRLDRGKLLCVVPDKILHYLPFAALLSGETGRYLVEDYEITRAPSATVFVECSERARRKAGAPEERVLSVGDPAFDRAAFPALPALPAAGAEARSVAALYRPPSRLLLGGNATEGAVRDEVGNYEVVNFALHYVVNDDSNMLSGMALARAGAGGEGDGFWQVFEMYQISLPRTRLVVLSACRTGVEQQYRGEGAASVARPFLAAGVPVVVASLWPVNSESTARLVVALHKSRTQERAPTAEALRRAQLALLKGDDDRYRHPHHWAAFTAIGGYTDF